MRKREPATITTATMTNQLDDDDHQDQDNSLIPAAELVFYFRSPAFLLIFMWSHLAFVAVMMRTERVDR